jgi:hypothetical protein
LIFNFISGFTIDSTTGYCYYALNYITYYDDAVNECSSLAAELLVFDSVTQITAFLAVLNAGMSLNIHILTYPNLTKPSLT